MQQKFIVPGTDAAGSPGDPGPDSCWTLSVSTREETRMEARATLRPGQRGTKKLVTRFGDRLICVRYRYDSTRRKRFTTVELIVDESDWTASIPIAPEAKPPGPTESQTGTPTGAPAGAPKEPDGKPSMPRPDLVGLRVGFEEMALRQKLKAAGARWDPGRRLWMLSRHRAIGLGLQERIATPTGE